MACMTGADRPALLVLPSSQQVPQASSTTCESRRLDLWLVSTPYELKSVLVHARSCAPRSQSAVVDFLRMSVPAARAVQDFTSLHLFFYFFPESQPSNMAS